MATLAELISENSDLKSNEIDLIIADGYISDFKKSQLKSINCSLVDYVTEEKINFICRKFQFDPVFDNKINLKNILLYIYNHI